MAPHTLLLLLALVTCAYGSFFAGSLMTYYPKEQGPNGSFLVDLHFKQNYLGTCSRSNDWRCSTGDCGVIISSDISEVFHGNEACQSEGILRVYVPTNKPFAMRVTNVHDGSEDWHSIMHVDLGFRSDTGAPNRPPVITIPPVVSIARNCPHTTKLLSHDLDGDQVRCRFAGVSECKVCASHSNFHLDEDTCELHHHGNADIGMHFFEIVVEDFTREEIMLCYTDGNETTATRNTTTAMSKLPLSFVIKVKPALDNCTEGVFRPALVAPSPQHGDIFQVSAEETLEIAIAAETLLAPLTGFVVSGPTGISLSQSLNGSSGEMIIKWTPTETEVYDHYPLCFNAESIVGGNYFHSEIRCVIAQVGPKLGQANVVCGPTTMTIAAARSLVRGLEEKVLRLLDPSCPVTWNDTHVHVVTALDGCGTEAEEDSNSITFRNEILTVENASDIITRTDDLEIRFSCKYPKREIVSAHIRAHKVNSVFMEERFGTFALAFEFFRSNHYAEKVDSSSFPLDVRLSEMIFMEIKSTSSLKNTVLFVESCRAIPDENPNHSTFYSIIENGCAVEKTVNKFPSQSNEFRFGVQVFNFFELHDEVYITCSVMLCLADDPDTRCAQGCISPGNVVKRSTAGQTARHTVVQGPLRLIRNSAGEGVRAAGAPRVTMSMNFLAITIVAAIAFVTGIVFYKILKSRQQVTSHL